MKYSIYNNYIEYRGGFIAFNALSMGLLYLAPKLMELINFNQPKDLENIHPDFYSALKVNGFLCENKIDEFKYAANLIQSINNDTKSYRLIVNPTTNCNFHCWYCYENHGKINKMRDEIQERVCLHIKQIMSKKDLEHFQLSFFGGEPLLYYSEVMLPIAKYAKDCATTYHKDYAMDITSNAYLFNSCRLEKLRGLGLASCQITLDGNKEKHNKTRFPHKNIGSYSTIIHNIHSAVELGIEVVLRINYTQENLSDLELIFKDFDDLSTEKRKLITLSMNKVWQETNKNLDDSVNRFIDLAEEFGFTIPDAVLEDHVRNSCYADKVNEAVINFDGKVYKCNARDFTDERQEGMLDSDGNIIWNSLHSKRNEVRIQNKQCKQCSVFPICGGGCSQIALENAGKDYCIGKEGMEESIKHMFLSNYCIKRNI